MSAVQDIPLAAKVAEAKQRLPLPRLMEQRRLADHAKASAFCPFHENTKSKAFSVYQDERGLWRWKCHSQCGSGDEITLIEKLDKLSNKEATRSYLVAAGVEGHSGPSLRNTDTFTPPPRPPAPPRNSPSFPEMDSGSADDLARLAELRHVSMAALRIASDVGLLRFATLRDRRAWIITDAERLNAQARRLDGQLWQHLAAKAWTLPGAWASHPIGRTLALTYPNILLVEGGGDLLAALHFIHQAGRESDCCPVAMLGASQRIPALALPIFTGKRVRVYGHTDPQGQQAARKWAARLAEAGAAKIDGFDFTGLHRANGEPVGDLNDCTTIHADDAGELEGLLP